MESMSAPSQKEDEISLKELILNVQKWGKYLWGKWLVFLICGLIGAGLGLTYSLSKETEYVAELSFVLEDSKPNGIAAYAGLASQFGLDLGMGGSSGVFSGDNILEFLKSKLMVQKTLLSAATIDNKQQTLAEYYIDFNEMRKSWDIDPVLKDIHFPLNANRANFSIQQDSVLNIIYIGIIKNNLSVTKPDKKLSFISVKYTSKNELFSKAFTEKLVKEATNFYVQTKTQRSKATVDMLQAKADSITVLLNRRTYSVAASQDMNLNPARSMAGVSTELVARDKIVLQTMYAEVVKNLELSRMTMAQEMPIIQIVDTPILPLKKEKFGKLKGLLLGGIISGFLAGVWLLSKQIYREIMT